MLELCLRHAAGLVNPKASVEDAFMTYEFIRTHDFAVGLACHSAAATTHKTSGRQGGGHYDENDTTYEICF